MKRSLIIFIFISAIILSGCEEEFNPKQDFSEKYILYGVIENMPQTPYIMLNAAVMRTYNVDGFNPVVDTSDHSLADCDVTLIIGDREIKLQQMYKKKIGTTFTPRYSYSVSGFTVRPNEEVKIKAVLPNGKVLNSKTRVPEILSVLEFSFPFNSGVHTKLNRFIWGDTWKIDWDSFNDYLYFPRLTLSYFVSTDSSSTYHTVEIPMKYAKKNGKFEPVFPSYTWDKHIEYGYECIDSVMTQISAGDTAKSRYTINKIVFSILEFDVNLASYFSSTNGYLDNYSIRLDESVYSNIAGGIGIFGAYTKNLQNFKVEKAYVESFGYTWKDYY